MAYEFKRIEQKWQKYWDENHTFEADSSDKTKPKFYGLVEFPYPSGYSAGYCFEKAQNGRL